jgi:hypothetical protein
MSIDTRTRVNGTPVKGRGPAGGPAARAAGGVNAGGWGRGRLVAVLAAVAAALAVMLGGLGYAVYLAFGSASSSTPGDAGHPVFHRGTEPGDSGGGLVGAAGSARGEELGQEHRDAIAAEPMLPATPDDMRPTAPAADAAPTIAIAMATHGGPATVPTGLPHTPEGAVGQLAAIETTVLRAMSIPLTNQIYDRWVIPRPDASSHGNGDGSGIAAWELTQNVQAFLAATSAGQEKDLTTTVVAKPAAGLVKGSDGPDWTVACVLLQMRATITTDAQMGYGFCARMQWMARSEAVSNGADAADGKHSPAGRWMIAPGTPPAKAPSTWPGSELSRKAGWRTWNWATTQSSDPSSDPSSDRSSDGAGE